MKKYSDETVYFISYAKLPSEISAANLHKVVGVGLVINYKTGIIEDSSCTLITDEARGFLKQLLVSHNIHEEGVDGMINAVKSRYHGLAEKAICVSLKSSYERYMIWRSDHNMK